MVKKISKSTFTIFIVLAVIVMVGFLFYSFNKRSSLFEGQTTNPATPGEEENVEVLIAQMVASVNAIDTSKSIPATRAIKTGIIASLNKLNADFVGAPAAFEALSKKIVKDFKAIEEDILKLNAAMIFDGSAPKPNAAPQ